MGTMWFKTLVPEPGDDQQPHKSPGYMLRETLLGDQKWEANCVCTPWALRGQGWGELSHSNGIPGLG